MILTKSPAPHQPWKLFLFGAIAPALCYLLTTLLGGSETVELFTQTTPISGGSLILGVTHVSLHAFTILIAPILAIAAVLLLLWQKTRAGSG